MNMKKSWAVVSTAALLVSLGSPYAVAASTEEAQATTSQTTSQEVATEKKETKATPKVNTQASEVKTFDEWFPTNSSLALKVADDLGMYTGDLVSLERLQKITWLSLVHTQTRGIEVLSGLAGLTITGGVFIEDLKKLPNLESLDIYENTGLTNLDFLKELPPMSHLMITGSALTNIEGLRYQPSMRTLDLSANDQVTDWSPLESLSNVYDFTFQSNFVQDSSFFAGMKSLSYVDARGSQISDISGLANASNLINVNLAGNQIQNIEAFRGKQNLKELDLSSNPIQDISPLEGLQLESLNLNYCKLPKNVDLSSVQAMTSLKELLLSENYLGKVPDFTQLTNLENLNMGGNSLTDASFVNELPWVTKISLHNNAIQDFSVIQNPEQRPGLQLTGQRVTLPVHYVRGDEEIRIDNPFIGFNGEAYALDKGTVNGSSSFASTVSSYDAATDQLVLKNLWTNQARAVKEGVLTYAKTYFNDAPSSSGSMMIPIEFADDQVVTFDPMGGVLASDTEQLVFPGEKVKEPDSPTRTGYQFKGWTFEQDGELSFWNFPTQKMPNAPIILQATWEKETYTLQYQANTSDVVENLPSDQSYTVEDPARVAETIPTREGYTFLGWNTQADGQGKSVSAGEDWSDAAQSVLYAQWKADTIMVDPLPEPTPDPESTT
ncbi:leucine-rich repeat domain-containing protein, partial [Listeria floridensis]